LVDSVGCPLDTDKDGIADYEDNCPNTAVEDIKYVDATGCIADTDGDGILDNMDRCPETPTAAYDYIDQYGCPIDTDQDGVADYMDRCPNTPEAARSQVDQYGCPADSDGDGVADYLDKCPNTIPEARYHVDENGCMKDTDGDGIYDYEDECPRLSGKTSNNGCPELSKEVRKILNRAMRGIQFENNKATIKPSSYPILDEVADIFLKNPAYTIEVQGHTDNVGNYQYNINLSEERAKAVREYMVNKGVEPERITAHGYGPDRPLTTNDTKEGRALNRRVEFNITFEEIVIQ
jgi:outer membrane protein OmpA-like peptidoglycan-associated protein